MRRTIVVHTWYEQQIALLTPDSTEICLFTLTDLRSVSVWNARAPPFGKKASRRIAMAVHPGEPTFRSITAAAGREEVKGDRILFNLFFFNLW